MPANRSTDIYAYLAKIESVEGTDAVPTGSLNAIEVAEPPAPSEDFAFKPSSDNRQFGHLHPADPLRMAGPIGGGARRVYLRGNSSFATAGSPLEANPLFLTSGHAATYDATGGAEKVTYTLADTGIPTMTEYFYQDGLLYKYLGVRGTAAFEFDVGGPLTMNYTASGRNGGVVDAAMIGSITTPGTEWPLATDMTVFTIDGYTAGIIRHWGHDLGNNVSRRDGVKAPGGVVSFRIGRRDPTFTVTLEETLIADKDWRGLRDNKTPIAISWLLGGTTYQRWDFNAPRAFIREIAHSNDNSLALITITGVLRGAAPFSLACR